MFEPTVQDDGYDIYVEESNGCRALIVRANGNCQVRWISVDEASYRNIVMMLILR